MTLSGTHNILNEREQMILQTLIQLYILKASPIGSRTLSKYLERELKLSPATLRNIMSDLEEMEYIAHPHTSAGRIPTDKGYRFYVDSLMNIQYLTEKEILTLKQTLGNAPTENVLKDASKLLGLLSKYLAVVQIPTITNLIVHKIELVPISSTRLLFIIALDSNIVRTATLEADTEFDHHHLDEISSLINEKICGKSLNFIKDNFSTLISDIETPNPTLFRLFVDSVDLLFNKYNTMERIHIAGTKHLLNEPEFDDVDKVRGIMELIENEDIIIHILSQYENRESDFKILIGKEMNNELLDDYSLVLSNYQIGQATGSIGLIGPKRMNYSKMVSLVSQISKIISRKE